ELGEIESVRVNAFLNKEYTDDLVPTMTNYTVPEGRVSASSYSQSGTYYPFRAFDDDLTSNSWIANSNENEWIQYQFVQPTKVSRYSMYCRKNPSWHPKKWDFMGSHDGVNWILLDYKENFTD